MSYIYQRVNVSDFRDAFRQCGREAQFSYEALGALFDHFSDLADDTGDPIELDPIAVCVEWSEFESALIAARAYAYDAATETEANALEYLRDHTTVVEYGNGNGVVVVDF